MFLEKTIKFRVRYPGISIKLKSATFIRNSIFDPGFKDQIKKKKIYLVLDLTLTQPWIRGRIPKKLYTLTL